MANSTNKNINRKSVLKWALIIGVNAIIALTVILMSVFYTLKQNDSRYSDKEQSFSSALDAMGQTAYMNLHTEQVFSDNWATYINPREGRNETLKLSTVKEFLGQVNTDTNRVLVEVLNFDYEGFYITNENGEIKTPELHFGNNESVKESLKDVFEDLPNCTKAKGSHLHLTRPFKNIALQNTDGTITEEITVAFCNKITAYDDLIEKDYVEGSGVQPKDFVLMRLLPVRDFFGQWIPSSFEKARLSLINSSGDFIIPFNMIDENNVGKKVDLVTEDNFFEYLGNKTDAGEETVTALREEFAAKLAGEYKGQYRGEIRCANAGNEGYYSYHRIETDEEWVLVGFIRRSNLNVINLDVTLSIIVVAGFLLLILFDGIYIIITNKHLKRSMEEIKFANEAKTRFLSSMSHDIRTPMNAIIGMTTIAAKRIDDKQQVSECLKQITRASNHLLTLINDVLDISKVESGKLALNPSVFSLADLMGNIISIVQPHVKEKEMEFEIHARKIRYEYIFADELRLNQILINLISNAIKYTPEKGKVLISVEEQSSEMTPNITRVIFNIKDTGIGISEEFMKHMYETFSRDIDSRINTIQGAGLGLAITKQMVDMMNGKIDVKSKVGEGTEFTVTLDLPIAERVTDEYMLPPMRVLVVDDDEVFLESAEDTLNSLGLDAEAVSSGAEAVKRVEENHEKGNDYRCVIVDWIMPDMDGLETIRRIRKQVGADVPVIIISAYDWTEIEEEAIKAGANGFITKPLFRSTVYNKLSELLKLNPEEKPVEEVNEDDLKGLHFLIAEDNDVNWEIINVMLEFHGMTSDRAENGQICVDKINAAKEGEYAAILMDVQMPVMNGKEATVEIRKSDKEYVRNIPIIAMTADAFAEDIASCKEAGMNGHVAKPVDMQKLIDELRSAIKLKK